MTTFIVGFDNKWQEKFSNQGEAIEWAREVAATGARLRSSNDGSASANFSRFPGFGAGRTEGALETTGRPLHRRLSRSHLRQRFRR